MKKYYIVLTSWMKSDNAFKKNWYYYGKKTLREYGRIYDMSDMLCSDVKLYKSKKRAEKMAKEICEFNVKGYSWMDFSCEVKEMEIS